MKKWLFIAMGIVALGGLSWAGVFYWKNLRGILPALRAPSKNIVDLIEAPRPSSSANPSSQNSSSLSPAQNNTGMPLKLPPGFSISIFAKNLAGARVMAFSPVGNMAVSRTSEGVITILEIQNGKVVNQYDYLKNLRKPHGLAFDSSTDSELLYYAEEDKISFVPVSSTRIPQKIADLPSGGGHFTRTLGFGPDKRLYVSIGSSCNACIEKDDRRAKIFSMARDGSDFKEFARGLRNAVFFTWHPSTKELWATEMGRDLIGDDIPPDEINIIKEENLSTGLGAGNYGWPNCYGKNFVDTDFHKSGHMHVRADCDSRFESPSYIDIPAHSAPLGLTFIPATDAWPKEYWNNLLVSYHGSWNRSIPTGYKVVRYTLDENGNYQGASLIAEDFITGWLTARMKEALGRPVDIVIHEGVIYISDDKAGVIYRVTYAK